MKEGTPKAELERKYSAFLAEVQTSQAYWNVFREIVLGNNYTSSIARKLRKNKSIVSRQLRRLYQTGLVVQMGSGVKQFYGVNWLTFTTFWIWFADMFVEMVGDLKGMLFVHDSIPDWLSEFYLTGEESKLRGKSSLNVERLLDPITPQLSEIVRYVVEAVSHESDVRSFWDAFREVSIAFGAGLPDQKHVDFKKIDIAYNRQLVETLYSPKVRVWLKLLVLGNLASSNIVRNHILRLAGNIES